MSVNFVRFVHTFPLPHNATWGNTQIEIVSDILEYLFRNDRDKANAIYSLRDYYKYFMYRLDDKVLTVDELMSLAEKDDAEMINLRISYI